MRPLSLPPVPPTSALWPLPEPVARCVLSHTHRTRKQYCGESFLELKSARLRQGSTDKRENRTQENGRCKVGEGHRTEQIVLCGAKMASNNSRRLPPRGLSRPSKFLRLQLGPPPAATAGGTDGGNSVPRGTTEHPDSGVHQTQGPSRQPTRHRVPALRTTHTHTGAEVHRCARVETSCTGASWRRARRRFWQQLRRCQQSQRRRCARLGGNRGLAWG